MFYKGFMIYYTGSDEWGDEDCYSVERRYCSYSSYEEGNIPRISSYSTRFVTNKTLEECKQYVNDQQEEYTLSRIDRFKISELVTEKFKLSQKLLDEALEIQEWSQNINRDF